MWELDHKEGWALKNWCFRTMALEKTRESPLDSKEIKPVNPEGNQPEHSLEGLKLKLKLQYFGHLMWRTNSSEKTLTLVKIEGKRRRAILDEMVVWHHWLSGHEFEQTPGDSEGEGSLVCCSSWGRKESNTIATEQQWAKKKKSENKHFKKMITLPSKKNQMRKTKSNNREVRPPCKKYHGHALEYSIS